MHVNKNSNILTFLTIITIMFLSCGAAGFYFANLTGILISNNILMIVLFISIIFSVRRTYTNNIYITIISTIVLIISVLGNYIVSNGEVFNVFIGTFLILLISLNFDFEYNEKLIYYIFIVFSLFLSILGIMQSFLSDPILQTTFNGKPIVNTIYFFEGISSQFHINPAETVRAFGITDSGLTLGVIVLGAFLISLYYKMNKLLRVFITVIFCLAIYSTYTRNVYFAFLLGLFFVIFNRKKWHPLFLKVSFLFLTFVSMIFPFLNDLISYFTSFFEGFGIKTFQVRFTFINDFINNLNSPLKIFFGSSISPSVNNPIDNGPIATLLYSGMIFYSLVTVIYTIILFKAIDSPNGKKGLIIFCLLMPFISIANNVNGTYIYFFLLLSIFNHKLITNNNNIVSY